jgi:hypothetical protein
MSENDLVRDEEEFGVMISALERVPKEDWKKEVIMSRDL